MQLSVELQYLQLAPLLQNKSPSTLTLLNEVYLQFNFNPYFNFLVVVQQMNATHTPNRFVHSSILPSPRVTRSGAENKRTTSMKTLKTKNKVCDDSIIPNF